MHWNRQSRRPEAAVAAAAALQRSSLSCTAQALLQLRFFSEKQKA
jgi:hypothetical protein